MIEQGFKLSDEMKWKLYKDDLGGFPGYDVNGQIIDEELARQTRIGFGSPEKPATSLTVAEKAGLA